MEGPAGLESYCLSSDARVGGLYIATLVRSFMLKGKPLLFVSCRTLGNRFSVSSSVSID